MAPFDPLLDPQRVEPTLTAKEQAVRDVFVSEYMKDFDAYRACIRMGFLAAFAIDMARTFLLDGYVLRKVDHMTRIAVIDPEADKQVMLQNLRWLSLNSSSQAVRASATTKYMEAQGYIEKDGGGAEAANAALIAALETFADKAPS